MGWCLVDIGSISCLWETRLGDFTASVRSLIGCPPSGYLDSSPQNSTRQRTSVRAPCPFPKRREGQTSIVPSSMISPAGRYRNYNIHTERTFPARTENRLRSNMAEKGLWQTCLGGVRNRGTCRCRNQRGVGYSIPLPCPHRLPLSLHYIFRPRDFPDSAEGKSSAARGSVLSYLVGAHQRRSKLRL